MLVWADAEGREWVSRHLVSEEDLAASRGGGGRKRVKDTSTTDGPKAGDGAIDAPTRT